jgi:excisionase family DNA binding protein
MAYLRIGKTGLYELIARGEIRVIKEGRRRFIPGSEIVRKSCVQAEI